MSDNPDSDSVPASQTEDAQVSTQEQVDMENTMHDKCKNVVAFHNNLSKFFKSLKGVLPEYVETIRESIKYYKSISRSSYLEECEALLKPHIEHISQYDDGIFTDDYKEGPRYLLPQMDFREIWGLLMMRISKMMLHFNRRPRRRFTTTYKLCMSVFKWH